MEISEIIEGIQNQFEHNLKGIDDFFTQQIAEAFEKNDHIALLLGLYFVDQNKKKNLEEKYKEFILRKFEDLDPISIDSLNFLKYLCFIEPIFSDEMRYAIYNQYGDTLDDQDFSHFDYVPIIAEYLEGYRYRTRQKESRDKLKKNLIKDPKIKKLIRNKHFGLTIHSSKGGVGKTFCSLLLSIISRKQCTILDFDFHGASIPFAIKDDNLISKLEANMFYTFYRLYKKLTETTELDTSELKEYIYNIENTERKIGCIIQTGGYSLGAYLNNETISKGLDFIKITSKIIENLIEEEKFLVLDNSPGLYGHSNDIFYIANLFEFLPVYVATSKPDSLLPILYELPWNITETRKMPILIVNKTKGFDLYDFIIKGRKKDLPGINGNILSYNNYLTAFNMIIPIREDENSGVLYLGNNKSVPYFCIPYDPDIEDNTVLDASVLESYIGSNQQIFQKMKKTILGGQKKNER